jgi:putative tryptophan/tyrosine transport system substrate-binding protein
MNRRELISLFGGAAITSPLTASAQQRAMPLLGLLSGADPVGYAPQLEGFRLGLRDHGFVEGQTIKIEYRWAESRYDQLPALAADLVSRKVDIIITQGTPAALAAKRATSTIPIVMAVVGNPVETGIVASVARPGGNITGSSVFYDEINAKRVELLKDMMPLLARMGVLLNPDNPANDSVMRTATRAAKALNVILQSVNVRRSEEFEAAFERERPQIEALLVVDDGLAIANPRRIAELAIKSRLPSIGFREYCQAGGLAAYGVDFPHIWRNAGAFVDKILKGRRPADLPIEQATRFEFMINLKTAKALSFDMPPDISALATAIE